MYMESVESEQGEVLVPLSRLAPMLGMSPAALYQAHCRREIVLEHIKGRWYGRMPEVDAPKA